MQPQHWTPRRAGRSVVHAVAVRRARAAAVTVGKAIAAVAVTGAVAAAGAVAVTGAVAAAGAAAVAVVVTDTVAVVTALAAGQVTNSGHTPVGSAQVTGVYRRPSLCLPSSHHQPQQQLQ